MPRPDRAEADRLAPARVAVVDDDPALRRLLHNALLGAGYDVRTFGSGDEALEAAGDSCPDVLISDLVMPGLNGQQLAAALRRRCPRTILIFMSGYTDRQLREIDITQVVFFPKPISPRDLVETVGRLMDARK